MGAWMPLNNFKKVHEDDKTATMQHPDGHTVTLAKSILSPTMRQQLASLPMHKNNPKMARGGKVHKMAEGGDPGDDEPQPPNLGVNTQMPQPQMPSMPPPSGYGNMPVPPGGGGGGGAPGGAPPNMMQGYPQMRQGMQEMRKGAVSGANAEANAYNQQAQAMQQTQQNMMDLQSRHQAQYKTLMDEYTNLKADVINNQIDPNHYMDSKSTGSKIATAIGVALSGFGGGLNHTGTNPALQFLNSQIDRDIASQQMNMGKKMNLLSASMQMFGHMDDALNFTKALEMGIMSAKVQQYTAQASSAKAKADGMQIAGQYDLQAGQLINDLSLRQLMGGRVGSVSSSGAGQNGAPPGMPGMPAGQQVNPQFLPPEMQKQSVGMPGGGIGLAYPGAENNARQASDEAQQLQKGFGHLQEDYKKGPVINPWGSQAHQNEQDVSNMQELAKKLVDAKRLSPLEYDNIKKMIPQPGSVFRGRTLDEMNRLKQFLFDRMNSQMTANIQGYQAPAQPSGGSFNAGSNQ